MTVKSRTCSS